MDLFHQINSSWIYFLNDKTNKRHPASTCDPNSIIFNQTLIHPPTLRFSAWIFGLQSVLPVGILYKKPF